MTMHKFSKTFRIYTENKNKEDIQALVSKYFEGFTLYEAKGVWKGKSEPSLVIEVLGHGSLTGIVREVAEKIKKLNNQEAILVQKIDNHAELF